MSDFESPYQNPETPFSSLPSQRVASKKRWLIPGIIVLVVLIVGGTGAWWIMHNKQHANTVTAISSNVVDVTVTQNGYQPSTIKIKRGQEVTWTNQDATPHRLNADQTSLPGFDSVDSLQKGDSYTYIFDTPGTFHYYDPADAKTYVGTVIVE